MYKYCALLLACTQIHTPWLLKFHSNKTGAHEMTKAEGYLTNFPTA